MMSQPSNRKQFTRWVRARWSRADEIQWWVRDTWWPGVRAQARLLKGDPQRREDFSGVRGRAQWITNGLAHMRWDYDFRARAIRRPLCWLAGSHVAGMTLGDDDTCSICRAKLPIDESGEWLPPKWWEVKVDG